MVYCLSMEVIVGKVVSGQGVGRVMGFPTLNIPYEGNSSGVFAASVEVNGKKYLAAVNVGGRPTFDDTRLLCEAFLLNCEGEFEVGSDDVLKVKLLRRVRETQKFKDMDSLALQISKDVEEIKNWYNAGEISF